MFNNRTPLFNFFRKQKYPDGAEKETGLTIGGSVALWISLLVLLLKDVPLVKIAALLNAFRP